jgi:hypothetical protein
VPDDDCHHASTLAAGPPLIGQELWNQGLNGQPIKRDQSVLTERAEVKGTKCLDPEPMSYPGLWGKGEVWRVK